MTKLPLEINLQNNYDIPQTLGIALKLLKVI